METVNELELVEDLVTFMKVTEREFSNMMCMDGFSGYVKDGKCFVKLKWMRDHGFAN